MRKGVIVIIFYFFAIVHGMGHPMPHSIFILDIKGENLFGELKMPLKELQFAVPFDITAQTTNLLQDERKKQLNDYFLAHIRPKGQNGSDWEVEILSMSLEETEQEATGRYQELSVKLLLKPNEEASARSFILYCDAIIHQVVTHKLFVNLRQDWHSGKNGDIEKNIGVIELSIADNTIKPLPINLDEGSVWKGLRSMIWLGINHIAEGIDHLLFLLVLLLPATLKAENGQWTIFNGTNRSVWNIVKIVSAFTIGHSISLLFGAKQWILLPQQPIEIAISITILITALHALKPIFPSKEVIVASAFGLIHGLAFSTVLTELNLGTKELAYSILGYNIGIELMQIFVLLLTMPWIIILSRNNHFDWIRIAGAVLAIIASLAWMMERITLKSNKISSVIELASHNGKWIIAILFLLAISSIVLVKMNKQNTVRKSS